MNRHELPRRQRCARIPSNRCCILTNAPSKPYPDARKHDGSQTYTTCCQHSTQKPGAHAFMRALVCHVCSGASNAFPLLKERVRGILPLVVDLEPGWEWPPHIKNKSSMSMSMSMSMSISSMSMSLWSRAHIVLSRLQKPLIFIYMV